MIEKNGVSDGYEMKIAVILYVKLYGECHRSSFPSQLDAAFFRSYGTFLFKLFPVGRNIIQNGLIVQSLSYIR